MRVRSPGFWWEGLYRSFNYRKLNSTKGVRWRRRGSSLSLSASPHRVRSNQTSFEPSLSLETFRSSGRRLQADPVSKSFIFIGGGGECRHGAAWKRIRPHGGPTATLRAVEATVAPHTPTSRCYVSAYGPSPRLLVRESIDLCRSRRPLHPARTPRRGEESRSAWVYGLAPALLIRIVWSSCVRFALWT